MADDSELVERVATAMLRVAGSEVVIDRRLITMARAAIAEVQRWRPIETAPGDPVLLGFRRGLHALVGHIEGDTWGWLDDKMGFHPFVMQPIGWQPLPAPPQ